MFHGTTQAIPRRLVTICTLCWMRRFQQFELPHKILRARNEHAARILAAMRVNLTGYRLSTAESTAESATEATTEASCSA
jgi:hypothetical protein